MRMLALLFALISMPVLAADYSSWPDREECSAGGELLAQALPQTLPQSQSPPQLPTPYVDPSKPTKEQRHPGDYCCVHCRYNEIAFGDACLVPKKGEKFVCQAKKNCACPGKP